MAYLITNLGKKDKGEIINISSNRKTFSLTLINKCQVDQNASKIIEVDNYKISLKIPETGFWKLKSFINKNSSKNPFNLTLHISQ